MFQYNRIKQNLQCQQSRTILCINYIKFHFMHFIQFCLVSNDKAILKNGKIGENLVLTLMKQALLICFT